MRRFFVEQIPSQGQSLIIKGPEAQHINRVLRMGPGMRILLMDAEGFRCEAIIESAGRGEVHVLIDKVLAPLSPAPIEITLCQALLKSQSMDFVIQKASELGVHLIQPFSSERTVVKIQGEKTQGRLKRWRDIAVNASKQSNRVRPPEVTTPCTLFDLVEPWGREGFLRLVLWEDEKGKDLKSLLRGSNPSKHVVGIVGPEGGFSAKEVETLRKGGFVPISLGRRILRAETAALTLVAILQYEWGDLSLEEWRNGVVE